MMKKVYGDDCLSRSRIHKRFKRFQEGREALEDDERSGRPRNVVNEENENCAWIHQKRAEIIAEKHGIGIRNIRSVDLSYFDRKFGLDKGLCQMCSAHFKTTRKRADYLTKNRIVTINHSPYSPDMAPFDFYLFGKFIWQWKENVMLTLMLFKRLRPPYSTPYRRMT